MESVRYVRVVPNSHSFESLQNIITHATFRSEEITVDYLMTGFQNTKKRGWEIKKIDESKNNLPIIFKSVDDVIHLIKHDPHFSLDMFLSIIASTLESGYDLKETKQIKTKMTRKDVYSKIGDELDYQQLRWVVRRDANGTPDESKPPAEWLSYIRKHVRLADDAIYNLDDEEAMAQFRKIAGLAVRAMTIHGCPDRVIPEELLNENEG